MSLLRRLSNVAKGTWLTRTRTPASVAPEVEELARPRLSPASSGAPSTPHPKVESSSPKPVGPVKKTL